MMEWKGGSGWVGQGEGFFGLGLDGVEGGDQGVELLRDWGVVGWSGGVGLGGLGWSVRVG